MNAFIWLVSFFTYAVGMQSFACPKPTSVTWQTDSASILEGEWVVLEQIPSTVSTRSSCKFIRKGSVFSFHSDSLEIYLDATEKRCDVYRFKFSGNLITFYKEDMLWLCRFDVKGYQLKLSSENFFTVTRAAEATMEVNEPKRVVIVLNRKR